MSGVKTVLVNVQYLKAFESIVQIPTVFSYVTRFPEIETNQRSHWRNETVIIGGKCKVDFNSNTIRLMDSSCK